MSAEVKPIRSNADHKAALAEIERLWGAKAGTPEGDRLEALATLIDAYESEDFSCDASLIEPLSQTDRRCMTAVVRTRDTRRTFCPQTVEPRLWIGR